MRNLSCLCPGPTIWRIDVPNSLAKASDRRVRADNEQWVMGHGLNGSTNRDRSHGSWVSTRDPLTHD